MARKFKQHSSSDTEIDSEEEIWSTILYLDPDREPRTSDVVVFVIWTLLFISIGVIIFLLNH